MDTLSITLYKTEGSTDKVYKLQLDPQDSGWIVAYQNGRRGKPLKSGLRTANGPVDYDAARKLYDKVVKGKLADGYTEQEDGVAYAGTDKAGLVTGFKPQLLNDTDSDSLLELLDTNEWGWQIKHDGERRGVAIAGTTRTYSNRSGLQVGITEPIDTTIAALGAVLTGATELDGEDMGTHLVVFDVLAWDGRDLRQEPYATRQEFLGVLQAHLEALGITAVRISRPLPIGGRAANQALLDTLRAQGEEGVVARLLSAPAIAGRPNSGGPARKCKFWNDATVRVSGRHATKQSIQLELFDAQQQGWVGVGNCTIPANTPMPATGTLVDVRYLYAYPGGSLFQPTFVRRRSDLTEAAATTQQLVYKTA